MVILRLMIKWILMDGDRIQGQFVKYFLLKTSSGCFQWPGKFRLTWIEAKTCFRKIKIWCQCIG